MGYTKADENPFEGMILPVKLSGQSELHKGQRLRLQSVFNDGMDSGKEQSYNCRVALDVLSLLQGGIVDANGDTWVANTNSHPQFYKNYKGHVTLTFGLINHDGSKKITYSWRGFDEIPPELIITAVEYDRGERVNSRTINLEFDKAAAMKPQYGNRYIKPEDRIAPRKRPYKNCKGEPRRFDRPGFDDMKEAKRIIASRNRRNRKT